MIQAEESNQGSADNRLILETGEHKNGCAVNKITNQIPMASKKSRTPVFGVTNINMLSVIDMKAKRTSCFSPEITCQDIKTSLDKQWKLFWLVPG